MAPALDPSEIHRLALARVQEELTPEERTASVVYLDTTLHAPGPVATGSVMTKIHEPRCVLFIDEKPGANWMHPCRYLLLNPTTGSLKSVNADRPPVFGTLPVSWSVLWQAPGVEAWRLLPVASTNPT